MREHLNIWQAKKSVRTARKESLCVFPGDLMNDVKGNETEHTSEQGVTKAIPICQTN